MNAVTLQLPPDALEAIAERAAELLAERLPAHESSPYLTTEEAAEYLRAPVSRVYDLRSRGELPVFKDGSRNLFRREDLDALLQRDGGHR